MLIMPNDHNPKLKCGFFRFAASRLKPPLSNSALCYVCYDFLHILHFCNVKFAKATCKVKFDRATFESRCCFALRFSMKR